MLKTQTSNGTIPIMPFIAGPKFYPLFESKEHNSLEDLLQNFVFYWHRNLCLLIFIQQSSWSKGISETNLKLQMPCSKYMHRPVMSQADACTYCMHCPLTSQADACSYCMGPVVSISSWIYLYLQLLCHYSWNFLTRLIYAHSIGAI